MTSEDEDLARILRAKLNATEAEWEAAVDEFLARLPINYELNWGIPPETLDRMARRIFRPVLLRFTPERRAELLRELETGDEE